MNETFRKALFPLIIIAALVWLGAQTLSGDSNDEGLRFSAALALVKENPRGIERVTFHPSTQEVDFRLITGKTRTTVYPWTSQPSSSSSSSTRAASRSTRSEKARPRGGRS